MESQFITVIDSYLDAILSNKQFLINDTLKGYISKKEISKDDFIVEFISSDLLFSIICVIDDNIISMNNLITSDFYEIELSDFLFDFLTFEKDKKNLDYNLILKINEYVLGNNRLDIKKQIVNSKTKNINGESKLFEKMNDVFYKQIQKIISDYSNIYGKYSINAENFISNHFDRKKNISIFQMIEKMFHLKNEGYLLLSKEGIEFPIKYLYKRIHLNNNFSLIDWEILYKENPTLKEKKDNNLFIPEDISFQEINEKYMIEQKELFLHNKTKRDQTREEEKEDLPKRIKKVAEFYGDVNKNIGNSIIEKYILFKKYASSKF